MNSTEVREKLKAIFRSVAPEVDFNSLDLGRPLQDQIEIDSLDFYNVLVAIQKQTGVAVPDSKVAEFRGLGDLINYVSQKSGS